MVGVGGAPMHTTEKGSVALSVGGRQLVLHDVLLSETAHQGAGPVHEPQVLAGVKTFARDTGLGLSFPADGKSVLVYDGHECIATAETDDDALYVIRQPDLASGNDKTASISVVLSVPKGTLNVCCKKENVRQPVLTWFFRPPVSRKTRKYWAPPLGFTRPRTEKGPGRIPKRMPAHHPMYPRT